MPYIYATWKKPKSPRSYWCSSGGRGRGKPWPGFWFAGAVAGTVDYKKKVFFFCITGFFFLHYRVFIFFLQKKVITKMNTTLLV